MTVYLNVIYVCTQGSLLHTRIFLDVFHQLFCLTNNKNPKMM